MKEWTVEIYILDQDGKEKPARCFTKAVYNLHPSFENPTQSKSFPVSFIRFWSGPANDLPLFRSVHRAALQMHKRRMGRVRDVD